MVLVDLQVNWCLPHWRLTIDSIINGDFVIKLLMVLLVKLFVVLPLILPISHGQRIYMCNHKLKIE